MKTIILGVLALVILGGGGFGVYSYFMKPAEASPAAAGEEHAAAAEAGHKKPAHDPAHPLPVVELGRMMVPVIDREGISQVVSLVVSLEAFDQPSADKIKYNEPRLKNAYIQEMYGILNRHAALKGGVLQISTLQERLDKVSEKVLGANVAHGVVLQVVQQEPV